jgi:hypothetical protein
MTPTQGGEADYKVRIREMERTLAAYGLKIMGLEGDMEIVKEGVSNFRTFQKDNLTFMGWFKAREEQRDKREEAEKKAHDLKDDRRSKIHFWWLGILSALIVASVIWSASWVHHFFITHHISSNTSSITEPAPQHAKGD